MQSDGRPNPDELLELINRSEKNERGGQLRLFFGFAPGVGKTYRMLQAAHERLADGEEVAVGIVYSHKRTDTERLVSGLPVIPCRLVEYRGHMLEEFDLDAVLKRRPTLVLVDELAHSNAPGSRHKKRWQDVVELLDAGINVYSTLNVQHIESLNDVVAQVTGVAVKETVPDDVFDRVNQLELVDLSAEELLERLAEGKVYLGEQADRAANNFFRKSNLLALRELAMRQAADHVDAEAIVAGDGKSGAIGTRLLVCVGGAPSSADLIRRARRMAAQTHAPWFAVSVRSPQQAHDSRVDQHLKLAESLGATTARIESSERANALVAFATKHRVNQIVVGKPKHARFWDRVRGSFLQELIRESGQIDVHVVEGVAAPDGDVHVGPNSATPSASPDAYGWAAFIVLLATSFAHLARVTLGVPDVVMLYLLCVMWVAYQFGRGPSLLAAAISVAAFDFFFVPPFFTFAVDDAQYLLSFSTLFGVGFAISTLTSRLRNEERAATKRAEEAHVLSSLSKELVGVHRDESAGKIAAEHVARLLGRTVALKLSPSFNDGETPELYSVPAHHIWQPKSMGVLNWTLQHGRSAGFGTTTLPTAEVYAVPLVVDSRRVGALMVEVDAEFPLGPSDAAFLSKVADHLAILLDRMFLARSAKAADLKVERERIRGDLLSSVSHDLRTPLAVITGAASTLNEHRGLDLTSRDDLVSTICTQAAVLERRVAQILEMTRLAGANPDLHKEWVPWSELVGSALSDVSALIGKREVQLSLVPEDGGAEVDGLLIGKLLVNLIENAHKHSPPDVPITVTVTEKNGGLSPGDGEAQNLGKHWLIAVGDRGAGVPAEERQRVFERFFQGHGSTSGVGLGLAICKSIARLHQGDIQVVQNEGGGALFVCRLPWTPAPRYDGDPDPS